MIGLGCLLRGFGMAEISLKSVPSIHDLSVQGISFNKAVLKFHEKLVKPPPIHLV